MSKRLLCQTHPRHAVHRAVLFDHRSDFCIARRIRNDGDELKVLRCGTNHRGTADIDLLDCLGKCNVRLCHSLHKRIEIDHDEINRCDLQLPQCLLVFRIAAHSENPAVHEGIQGLDAAIHDLGKSRDITDIDNGNPRLTQRLHRPARGDDLNACLLQCPCEFDDTTLIGYADQGTFYLHNAPPSAGGRMCTCLPSVRSLPST